VAAICTLTTVLLFSALANALPHLFGRFFVVPLLLGIAPSVAVLREARCGKQNRGELSLRGSVRLRASGGGVA
jgi:uncharacterized membrane protein